MHFTKFVVGTHDGDFSDDELAYWHKCHTRHAGSINKLGGDDGQN